MLTSTVLRLNLLFQFWINLNEPKILGMNTNFGAKVLLLLLLKNFGWMTRSMIFSMDRNSVHLLIFYIIEAIATSEIGFSYR